MKLVEITDRRIWDEFVSLNAWGHPLQLWGWGEAKRGNGWTAHRLALGGGESGGDLIAGAEVLLWTIPKLRKKIAYIPRGPVVKPGSKESGRLLEALIDWAKANGALYLRIEPAWTYGAPGKGWVKAKHHIQLPETFTIDLAKPEAELLEPMSHKHRQYIRKAERDGVTVARETGVDLKPMFALYRETASRAGFGIHSEDYYELLHRELGEASRLYYAYIEGKPVAFLWLGVAGETAYELYGGVDKAGQEMKANYLLKWTAMMELKAENYRKYDFNGRLNEGVSRFKDGFGPDATDYIGTYDYPLSRLGYHAWENLWPVVKVVGRKLARRG